MRALFAPQWLALRIGRTAVRSTPALLTLTLAACGGGGGAAAPGGGPPGGAMPPMPVEAITLTDKPVDQFSDFVGTVKSRRSTTIQPQVEGFITRINVRSGDRVRAGQVLVEIDPSRQAAAVASLESQQVAQQADVEFARQQEKRMKTLYDAGANSLQELEQAQTAVRTSEAQLKAFAAQIRQQQVDLGYHKVTAPVAGIVGDIPSRVGDRVTNSTMITTVDQNEGLELYINVPVQQAPDLKTKMSVRILRENGELLTSTAINFISPSVDEQTQAVLVKAPLPPTAGFRTEQFVRARVVWSTNNGLTVPLTAVNRVNGQYFAFVAEKAENGTVARQRPVNLGTLIGNDYVVRSGLKPGEQLIVSGIQKIGDGAPVQVVPAAPAGGQPAGGAPAASAEGK